jgi:tetrahydroxynaphthalene reductase
VTGLVKCLAWDLGPKNITVNCIAAGGVKSDMYLENSRKYLKGGDELTWEEIDARIAAWRPLGRVGMPDDVAGVVALLASEEAGWITGQTVHVSGGGTWRRLDVVFGVECGNKMGNTPGNGLNERRCFAATQS